MTHQNHQTNGASLEDCHTNFFALTDLCGIKWRKFVNGERPNASSDPLSDPILRSYSRCVQADILCVWRRKSTKQDNSDPNALSFDSNPSKVHPPLSLAAAKELWIFWYGEEPDLSELVDGELLKVAANQALWNGTWERGLTYECRSLLFKALHNLMERFVLTKDIVRFGKWFVQPCTSNDRLFSRSSQHLSFSFTFFVHGDTVCASIDLREHPAVRPLTKEHLSDAAAAFAAMSNSLQHPTSLGHDHTISPNSPLDDIAPIGDADVLRCSSTTTNGTPKPRKVILAPFGMAAILTGNSYKATDPMAEKILEDWASFFPLCNKENSDIPPVVEVISGGHKMYHPSIYVLVTDLDDMEEMEAAALQKGDLGTTSSTEAAVLAALSTANVVNVASSNNNIATNSNNNNNYNNNNNNNSSSNNNSNSNNKASAKFGGNVLGDFKPVGLTGVGVGMGMGIGIGATAAASAAAATSSSTTATTITSMPLSGALNVTSIASTSLGTTSTTTTTTTTTMTTTKTLHAFEKRQCLSGIDDARMHVPYYETLTSSFTCNTANTHAPPQAATEMPERVWQDCITSTLHLTYANSITSANVGTTTTSSGGNGSTSSIIDGDDSATATASGASSSSTGNASTIDNVTGNNSNSNSNLATSSKQQQRQQQHFWGFFDPTQKAPCTCTKCHYYDDGNKKSTASSVLVTTTMVNTSTTDSTLTGTPRLLQPSSMYDATGANNINNNSNVMNNFCLGNQRTQQQQQKQKYQQLSTRCSGDDTKSMAMSRLHVRIPFHKRSYTTATTLTTTKTKTETKIKTTTFEYYNKQNKNNNNLMNLNFNCKYFNKNSIKNFQNIKTGGEFTVTFIKNNKTNNKNNNFYENFSTITTNATSTNNCTILKSRSMGSTTTPHGTPQGGGASTYSRNSIGDSMPVPSVGSPGTPAPSPHPSSALSQPTSVPPADQLLNMSPRAPASVSNLQQPTTPIDQLLDKNTPAPTPTDQHDSKSVTASPYVHPTPSVEAPPSAEGLHNNGMGPGSVPPPPSVGAPTAGGGHCTPTPTTTPSQTTTTIGQQLQMAAAAVASQQQQQQQLQQQQQQQQQNCGTITVKKFEVHGASNMLESDIKMEPGIPSYTNGANFPRIGLTGGSGSNSGAVLALSSTVNCGSSAYSATSYGEALNEYIKLCKPPELTVKDIDSFEDCLKLDVLYNYTEQDTWINHPMKRFRPNEVVKPIRALRSKNLYEGHTHCKPLMPSPGTVYGSQLLSIDASASATNNMHMLADSNVNSNAIGIGGLVGIASSSPMGDALDEETNNSASVFFQNREIKTEIMSGAAVSPCKDAKSGLGGNLYTADGLTPSIKDLEQIFETSSNDGCPSLQLHTPPDSNNPSNGCNASNSMDDLKRGTSIPSTVPVNVAAVAAGNTVGPMALAALQNCANLSNASTTCGGNNSSTNVGANSIQVEDLTKMFPTPPSHEQHHPNSSPCQMDIQMTDLSVITSTTNIDSGLGITSAMIKIRQEFFVELGSPAEEPLEDLSYVYRPPQQAKFVGSSKYAPLNNLPSQTLPPLVIPPNFTYKPSWTKQQTRSAAVVAQQQQQVHQVQQQQQQQQQQHHQHQQLQELLSAAPRTPLTQPRTPLGPMPSPMHSNTVPLPLSSGGGSNLLLNQLNCPQAALTNTHGGVGVGGPPTMQQLMQRAGMSPISPASAGVPFPRGSPMLQPQRQTPIHPPPPYEIAVASPATSTSSYLNRQYNSQEPPRTPQSVGVPTAMGGSQSGGVVGHLTTGVGGLCDTAGAVHELPEVSSLIVNILLYDTALNVFRDHNFDSSTVCVCNADTHKVGNIRGADSGVYVPLPGNSFNLSPATLSSAQGVGVGPNSRVLSAFGGGVVMNTLDSPASLPGAGSGHAGSSSSSSTTPAASNQQHVTGYVDDDPFDCTCGFSAVVNRRLAHRAGLFYEDEMEITGIADDPGKNKKQPLVSLITSLKSFSISASSTTAATVQGSKKINASALMPYGGSLGLGDSKAAVHADQQAYAIFDLLLDQCSIIQTSSSSIHRALQRQRRRLAKQNRQPHSVAAIDNVLEFVDANDIICLALEQARLAFENNRLDLSDFGSQSHQLSPLHTPPAIGRRTAPPPWCSRLGVHKWPYIPVGYTRSNKDIVNTMNRIQPMLQNAFHSKSRTAPGAKDATYTVSGPLTWRQFHRLAGRASGQCEPQPIPSVIVGHDKDWISVAPLAIHYWDKLLLEPYSYARDVVYLIICPDNEFVISNARTYFKELSSTYEMCKLGRHTPLRGWDGMLTVGARNPNENISTPLDDWLCTLEDTVLAEKIRVYANAFHNMLTPYLNRVPNDKTLLSPPEGSTTHNTHSASRERGTTSPMSGNGSNSMHGVGSSAIESEKSPKVEPGSTATCSTDQSMDSNLTDTKPDMKADAKPTIVLGDPLGMGETMEDINPPAIVLYVIEPFTFGSDSAELERLACVALLRSYSELLNNIPDSVRANLNIQIISLESILELGRNRSRKRFSDEIKCFALSIFSQCRRHLVHSQSVKSLTGFGTAADIEAFLKSKDEKNRQPFKMYTPPYVLAPVHEKNDKSDFSRATSSMRGLNEQKCSVMYCNYCISEDQSWLLASMTDDRGELLEKIAINIDVPNRMRRRKAPARRIGLKKLMDFIMGVISQTTHTWRLVIGRIGRIGHSELKSWSYLLSKPNLQKASKQLKDICKQCTLVYPPSVLSACLVTLEPDSKLRVMPDQFTPDERFSQIAMQNPLSTPQDVTCTHILVFPTSAVCLSFTRQFQNEPQVDLDNDFLNFEEVEDENEGFTNADLMDDLLGEWEPQLCPMSNRGSPDRNEDNRSWQSANGASFNTAQQQDVEEVGSINQQPLAVGYMVSTAPTGRMPSWFWAACPHLEDVCPVFLKTALHLHVPNIQTTDDILNSTIAHSSANDHPLDSSLTADVLRYVLEGYNALSWLALDSNTHDRLSCLPINVQTLMDLYYLMAAIA